MIKILFTSIGRRVELVQAFKTAALEENVELQIYGADISSTAPALAFCDKSYIVHRISSEEYIPELLAICQGEAIDAVIPTIDTDLLPLSMDKEKFEKIGTKVFVSDPSKIATCRDKRNTAKFFEEIGLNTPKTYDSCSEYKGGFPAFIKPKDGSSSIMAYQVNDESELKRYSQQVTDYIVQPYIEGTEYTVDILCDCDGAPIYITPRIRLAVRAGEVLKTKIRNDESIIAEMQMLIQKFKPCGAITVQLIQDSANKNWYIEINPRFGGGAPLSIKAGANSCKAILEILEGKPQTYQPGAAEDGAVFSRFDQSIKVSK